jgi:hypothetical protein
MCGATRSELIARMKRCSNEWDRTGAKTLKGRVYLIPRFTAGADRPERRLIETPRRRANPKARGRRSGEIPAKVFVASPRREKPKGAASGRCANYARVARDSWKG